MEEAGKLVNEVKKLPQVLAELVSSSTVQPSTMRSFGIILLIIGSIAIVTWISMRAINSSRKGAPSTPENITTLVNSLNLTIEAEGQGSQRSQSQGSLYSSLINNLEPSEAYLVNLCPLTASLGGYIGREEPGVFSSETYVQNALRSGIRSFIIPISVYLDDNKYPPHWPLSGKPAITCRKGGKIISLNGLTIKKFCTDLLTYNGLNVTQADEPILLYIKSTPGYIPDPIQSEKAYVQLTSDIAAELDIIPADRRLVTLGGFGSAVDTQNEGTILTQIPLIHLKNKFIIFTDFDTKLASKPAYAKITPVLANYTNFAVTLPDADKPGNARSMKLQDVSGSKVNWPDRARTVWHMTAQDDPLVVPDSTLLIGATSSGIQMIPVPFFMRPLTEVQSIINAWQGFAWQLKAPAARYTKPAPVVPAPANAKMNARVSPGLQPGQVAV